jgi:uncharacterized membrane protein YdjX (TVP38/TMEM64 family)
LNRWRLWLALGLVLAGVLCFAFLPLADWLRALVERARALGPGGAFLFMALFVPACVLMLPGTPITLFCGYAYGFWPTLPAAILMSNLGAAAAFGVSRFLLSGSVERWLGGHPKLLAVHRAVGTQGLRLVFLLRLTPAIPFNGLNYALGVAPVRFAPYALGTFLGMLPGTTINTYTAATLGELGRSLDEEVTLGAWGWTFLALRLVAAVLVTVLVTRTARKALAGAWRGDP